MGEQQTGIPIDGFEAIMFNTMGEGFTAQVSGSELGSDSDLADATEPLGHVALQMPFGVRDSERFGSILNKNGGDDDKAGNPYPDPSRSNRGTLVDGKTESDERNDD